MITWLNQWTQQSRFKKFWGIVKEIFWIDQLWIFEFHCEDNGSDNHSDNESDANTNSNFTITWKIATEQDIDRMKCLGNYDIDSGRETFMKSFVQSHHEYLLLGIKNEIIHTYAVCAVQKKRMYGSFFQLEDNEAFISVCFTKPESRGQGWGPKCIREICRRCKEIGKTRVFIDISTANPPSIRSAEKAGAKKTNSGYYCVRIWKKDHLLPFGFYKNRFSCLKNIN